MGSMVNLDVGTLISVRAGLGRMPFVGDQVAVRQCSDNKWKLLEDLVYEGRRETFTVPKNFETDFASVPQAFTWLVPRYGRYTRAAILHDYLCVESKGKRFARHDADGIFRRTMREMDVGVLRRWLMWIAVRFGAGWHSFWQPKPLRSIVVLIIGLLAVSFLVVPFVIVIAWLAAFWVLDQLIALAVKMARRKPATT